ncbi:Hypothetical predicted protein [Octopus vulgaris]|uniref:Uncharacterized protein n=1 Tax=Octopus vulgaris TaxID=6645 RepID=A0AA36F586_OCTVU|nr:Hypothetical predicted protein [Octopus vulgaris]
MKCGSGEIVEVLNGDKWICAVCKRLRQRKANLSDIYNLETAREDLKGNFPVNEKLISKKDVYTVLCLYTVREKKKLNLNVENEKWSFLQTNFSSLAKE